MGPPPRSTVLAAARAGTRAPARRPPAPPPQPPGPGALRPRPCCRRRPSASPPARRRWWWRRRLRRCGSERPPPLPRPPPRSCPESPWGPRPPRAYVTWSTSPSVGVAVSRSSLLLYLDVSVELCSSLERLFTWNL